MADEHSLPALIPVTDEAREAVGVDRIPVDSLPFRVGRDSRFGVIEGRVVSMERRDPDSKPNNDLYIRDQEEFLNISREHFRIEPIPGGGFEVVDRGSTCGTIVDGVVVGGKGSGGRAPLRHNSVIRVGTPNSPFLYRFVSETDPPPA